MKRDDLKARLPLIAMCLDSIKRADQGDVVRQALTAITDLEALVGELGEALFKTQWMLEQIVHHNSTCMADVHKRIIANRPTLAKLEKARG